MEVKQRINFLFSRYINQTITKDEFDELLVWLYGLDEEQLNSLSESQKYLWEKAKAGELTHAMDSAKSETILRNVLESDKIIPMSPAVKKIWPRVAAAIVILLFLGGGAYFIFNKGKQTEIAKESIVRKPETVVPNVNATVLEFGDGKQVKLDSIANGKIVGAKGINVEKLQDGEIAYNNTEKTAAVEFHTIKVPRGGRPYHLTLSDGSKIWVNAASSLRYPTVFTGTERVVELTGEGYFEVSSLPISQGKKMPFIVKYNNMQVEVLGTHFNVMAYDDEMEVQTTLLEGRVVVKSETSEVKINPGQQAKLNRSNGNLTSSNANTDLAVAWVKGYFQFDKSDVPTILRQVSRWYDLDIDYQGKVPQDLFSGKIERALPLSGIVHILDEGNVKVRVEGKKLIVL